MCLGTGVWEVGGRTEARRPVGTRPCEGAGTLSWGDRAWGGGGAQGQHRLWKEPPALWETDQRWETGGWVRVQVEEDEP